MSVDLEFQSAGVDRYSVITLIFFIPYVICQPPATVIMRKIGPRIFLAAITIMWGGIMIVSSTFLSISKPNHKLTRMAGFRIRQELD